MLALDLIGANLRTNGIVVDAGFATSVDSCRVRRRTKFLTLRKVLLLKFARGERDVNAGVTILCRAMLIPLERKQHLKLTQFID